MKDVFRWEILKLKNKKHVEKKIIQQFLYRLKAGKLTKESNSSDHYCCFFLPIDIKTKSIYLGHHIKANDWIPPGGHIKENETPIQTVRREFNEELKFKLTNEKNELFDVSILDVGVNPRHKCKLHYDFWYLVFTGKHNFKFDRKEFYDAGWFTIKDSLKKTRVKLYNKIIAKLSPMFKL